MIVTSTITSACCSLTANCKYSIFNSRELWSQIVFAGLEWQSRRRLKFSSLWFIPSMIPHTHESLSQDLPFAQSQLSFAHTNSVLSSINMKKWCWFRQNCADQRIRPFQTSTQFVLSSDHCSFNNNRRKNKEPPTTFYVIEKKYCF